MNKKLTYLFIIFFIFVLSGCSNNRSSEGETVYLDSNDPNVIIENNEIIYEVPEQSDDYDLSYIEDNIEIENKKDLYYGKIIDKEEKVLLAYTYLGLSYLNFEDFKNYNKGDYISFNLEKKSLENYPVTIDISNVEISDSINFFEHISNKIDFKNTYSIPYVDETTGYVVYETEIIDVDSSNDNNITYLAFTNEGPIYFFTNNEKVYDVGDFVDFYTDGLVLESYPAQIPNVYDSSLIEVD